MLDVIASRGAIDTAKNAKQVLNQVMGYAKQLGPVEHNAATDLNNVLPKSKTQHRAAITDPAKYGALLVDIGSQLTVYTCYHKVPVLWRFHAVHHSAEVLTPITLYRIHYLEMVFNAARSIAVAGFVGGIFIYGVDGKIQPLQLLGANIFSLFFNLAGANLRHSHIWLGFGKVERFILSPAQHQLHHSVNPKHFDKNFGVMIALWDRLFGTWVSSKNEEVTGFGLGYPVKQSLLSQLFGHKKM